MGLRLASIVAVAAAVAAGSATPALAASVNAQAKAKVVKPVTISLVQDLDLGTVVLGPGSWSGATISLSQTGALTCPAAVTCSGATQPAIYNVAGSKQETIAIDIPPVTLVNQASPAATLTLTPDGPASLQLTNSGNPGVNFSIGGSITVDSTTPDGDYVGTFNVTADYQ